MNDWFEWNGVRCTEYDIHVTKQPSLTMPNERVTYTNVPGRPGSLTTLEGEDVYDDLILDCDCVIRNPAQIPAVCKWLKGSGTVTFGNRQGGYYYARVSNQIPFDRILRGNPHCKFTVTFRCKPFWYAINIPPVVMTVSGGKIINPGSVYAEPVIDLGGDGDIVLHIGSQTVELTGVDGEMTLDCVLQEAYSGIGSLNNIMTGDFPRLEPGANTVTWEGDLDYIMFRPNWRYL